VQLDIWANGLSNGVDLLSLLGGPHGCAELSAPLASPNRHSAIPRMTYQNLGVVLLDLGLDLVDLCAGN
jgi:hypothetical protein